MHNLYQYDEIITIVLDFRVSGELCSAKKEPRTKFQSRSFGTNNIQDKNHKGFDSLKNVPFVIFNFLLIWILVFGS